MKTLISVSFALGLALIGCSSEGSSTTPIALKSCTEINTSFKACGGDVKGKWNVKQICYFTSTSPIPTCSDARVTVTASEPQGTIDFDGANAVFVGVQGTLKSDLVLPTSCTLGLGCSVIENEIKKTDPNGKCTEASEKCNCSLVSKLGPANETKTYALTEKTIAFGTDPAADYCVESGGGASNLYLVSNQEGGVKITFALTK
ncbi:MAG: hypothetical protein KBF88_12870 [Polyangiaceae bacterium]|nr:hypothetical protein [Polyangiaceae bacterium]